VWKTIFVQHFAGGLDIHNYLILILYLKFNYTEAFSTCCSLGMQLLSLDNDTEVVCLNSLNNSINIIEFQRSSNIKKIALLDDLNYVDRFLTSASSKDCFVRFEFCPDNGNVIVQNNTRW